MSDSAISVQLVTGPIGPSRPLLACDAGAVLLFEGIVRPTENGEPLDALDYEAYEPLTTRELQRLANRTLTDFGLIAMRVEHSVGCVAAGQVSFRLIVAAAHRAEAIGAIDRFINQMKQSIPLWKMPVYRLSND
ncbi:molybdopterin synthase catalytic subunit [Botrimarina hoheduenensis]|uniref:Molybdopterin synthase catalytic subunit n=1 Tax=Botrimarina hoheduenensis TaxID=2528000 RepID=A0A5C5VU30_9BACT|nr:molybdenum cofactor biosynthesis protein MoaE [Botrimarina hoheduenensis]TWT41425.1 Molybdopterin synthase catalytic subunit [Botrimarina hoheduenensis]